MKRKMIFVSIAVVSFLVGGCGYTTSSSLPGNLRTVHVKTFKNEIEYVGGRTRNIYLPLLEVDVRKTIIDRFMFDGNLRVVDEDAADLVLTGSLVNYNRSALRYTDDDDVQEYRVQVVVDLEMIDSETGELFWEEKGFAGEADYFIVGAQAITEDTAVDNAMLDLARRIVERTIENW